MRLVRAALGNPYAVIVGGLVVLVLGIVSLTRIPTDLLPTFKTPAVQVLTLYPGMPAEVVEKDITTRLERWTGQSTGIEHQESRSMLGVSIVRDYFHPKVDPNTALSQVTSLAMSDLYYLPPGTIPPMVMPFDPTASLPLALISVSSPIFDETKLYDVAYFDLRNRLQGIGGVIAPAVYGGKLRRILTYVDPMKLQARGLSPLDVVSALRTQNVLVPTGNAKLGDLDFQIVSNAMLPKVSDLDDIPIGVRGDAAILLRDVGRAADTSQIQTNVVRIDGRRQVYLPIYRQPGASTLAVVDGIKDAFKEILAKLPSGIDLAVAMDQSVLVRKAIRAVESEALLGAGFAALLILLFLGSLRSTLIVSLSIPLSVLVALLGLYGTGETLNLMTLGGIALATGRLVDDAIVVIENTERHLAIGKEPGQAALDAAGEVAMPVFVSTLTTCVVFLPVLFLTGIGRFLFSPLALTVALAMTGSYVASMTLVPAYCARFLRSSAHGRPAESLGAAAAPAGEARRLFPRFQAGFQRFQAGYARALGAAIARPRTVLVLAAGALGITFALYPFLGQELFPQTDAGQFNILVRAPSGTRIERTEEHVKKVEEVVRRVIPDGERALVISNIGVLNDWPAAYTPNAGPSDAFVAVQLREDHRTPTAAYVRRLRERFVAELPELEVAFDTGGLVTAALNFGVPSPIDVQVSGNSLETSRDLAEQAAARIRGIPGAVDVRIKQRLDWPQIVIDIDRIKAAYLGLSVDDVVKNVVTALNSSINFAPSFWIDEKNGNHYFIGAQYREEDIRDLDTLGDIPLTGPRQAAPIPLRSIATFRRSAAPSEINHLNIGRIVNLYANVEGRDVGGVARDVERAIASIKTPDGYALKLRGEVANMRASFGSLGFGLGLAAILVYLVLVAQFRSFGDPLVIMVAVPLGLLGVVLTLVITRTTLNVQSFMGTIMMLGIAVSNSILLVEFAGRLVRSGHAPLAAAAEAATVRLRPVVMTSVAAILGLLPMALKEGEPTAPLARAVIGGLGVSTVLTLFVVPVLWSLVHARGRAPEGA